MFSLFAVAIAFAQPSIDSVWFSEETDCDGRNVVEICYELSSDTRESTNTISVQMSDDGGATWNVPLDSIWDEVGDIGADVDTGLHCFYWEMGEDIPDSEGYGIVKISLPPNIYITDRENDRVVRIENMTGEGWITYEETDHPWDIELDASGKIYITERDRDRLIRIDDLSGSGWISYGSSGSGIGNFEIPHCIAFDSENCIYVAVLENHRIVKINDMD